MKHAIYWSRATREQECGLVQPDHWEVGSDRFYINADSNNTSVV